MMQDAPGVGGKLTEAGSKVYEHAPAAARALRQHGEHLALELHQGRRPGAPVSVLELQRLRGAFIILNRSWPITAATSPSL